MNLSFSMCHYMHQQDLSLSGQIQTFQPPFSPYPQYLQLIRFKENTVVTILGSLESEDSPCKRNSIKWKKIMANHDKRIRPEILDWSSKFGIIFVTEAYNESILLQDNTKMFHFWISGTQLLVSYLRTHTHTQKERSSKKYNKRFRTVFSRAMWYNPQFRFIRIITCWVLQKIPIFLTQKTSKGTPVVLSNTRPAVF